MILSVSPNAPAYPWEVLKLIKVCWITYRSLRFVVSYIIVFQRLSSRSLTPLSSWTLSPLFLSCLLISYLASILNVPGIMVHNGMSLKFEPIDCVIGIQRQLCTTFRCLQLRLIKFAMMHGIDKENYLFSTSSLCVIFYLPFVSHDAFPFFLNSCAGCIQIS